MSAPSPSTTRQGAAGPPDKALEKALGDLWAALGLDPDRPEADAHLDSTLGRGMGLVGEDLMAGLAAELSHEPNRSRFLEAREAMDAGRFPPFELIFTGATGMPVRVLITTRPDRERGRVACLTVLSDDVGCEAVDAEGHAEGPCLERLAVQTGLVGIWEWDLRTNVLRTNTSLKNWAGYGEEIGDSLEDWLEITHPEDRPKVEDAIAGHLRGETPEMSLEVRILHKEGGVLWFLLRGRATRDDDGTPLRMTGTNVDITEQKGAEEAIESERKRLLRLLERLPGFVYLQAPDHTIRYANRYFVDHFGEPGATPCHRLIQGQDTGCEVCPPLDVMTTGSLNVWDWDCERLDKSFQMYGYPFEDLDGSPLALVLGIDVTQRRRAQEALAASEQRYRSITDNLAMGIAVMDRRMRVTAANPRMVQWFGDPQALPAPPPCHEVLHPGEPPETLEACRECPAREVFSQGVLREFHYEATTLDGPRTFRVLLCPLTTARPSVGKTASGAPESLVAIFDDVTDKLAMDRRLERARKLEALGALAGGIAHEINQPLNALQLYGSGLLMLLERGAPVERETLIERMELILAQSRKIGEIITHMRSLVRQQARPEVGVCDLAAVVDDALGLVSAQLEAHGVRLEVDIPPGLPAVAANPTQLEQVVINLVINAMHALDELEDAPGEAPADKRLRIEAREAAHPAQAGVSLTVMDNGPGLGGKEDQVFDPFYTTKDAGGGMGMGLSLVHTFVHSWGGTVGAHASTLAPKPGAGGDGRGGGAAFTIQLRAGPGPSTGADTGD